MNYYGRQGQMAGDGTVYNTYLAKVAGLITQLLQRGYAVRVLIGDVVYDEHVRMDLRHLIESQGWSYNSGMIIDEPASSVSELLSQLAATDVVVASRFHNLLLGLMLGKPALAVSYHEKIVDLMSKAGLAEFCEDIEQIDVEELIERFSALAADAAGWKQRSGIGLQTEIYRRALEEQYQRILGTGATVDRDPDPTATDGQGAEIGAMRKAAG
jgi:polysaccharide pyruvyl transferase WcaK-like protein